MSSGFAFAELARKVSGQVPGKLRPGTSISASCDGAQEKNGEEVDPGAAVALGAPMVVRLLVPCWVVNATPLPISVAVVRMQRPAPPPAPDASMHGRQPGSLIKAADAMQNIKVYETGYTFKYEAYMPASVHQRSSVSAELESGALRFVTSRWTINGALHFVTLCCVTGSAV